MASISYDPQAVQQESIIETCGACEGRGYIFVDVRASYLDSDFEESNLYDLDARECPDCGGEGHIILD